MLASLLHRCSSTDVNQTLHDVWPSLGLVHYIYLFGGSCPQGNFARCKIHFAFKSCVLLYLQHYCTALEQWASAKLWRVQQRVRPIFSRAAIMLGIGPQTHILVCTVNAAHCFNKLLIWYYLWLSRNQFSFQSNSMWRWVSQVTHRIQFMTPN